MNRYIAIALLGTAFAVAAGLIVTNTISATPLLIAQSTTTQESGPILGHVTYVLTDPAGHVKKYVQTDNIVVDIGKKCALQQIFQRNTTGICTNMVTPPTSASNGFNWIAIGNGSGTAAATDLKLVGTGTAGVVNKTVNVTPTLSQVSGASGVATLSRVFSFNAGNQTTITSSALVDKVINGDMFAEKSGLGVTVSAGDSLTITWTINVG